MSAKDGYFNVSEWESLGKPEIKREDYRQYPSYLACDLSVKHDLTVVMQLFCLPERKYALFGKYFLPESALDRPENQHFRTWHIMGLLETSGETVMDYEPVKAHMLEICKDYNVIEIPSDPWQVFRELTEEGAPIVIFDLKTRTMSEPMKELDALIRSGRIIHDGDPLLAWTVGNTTGKEDANGNVFPRKEAAQNKIDPVVAAIMALSRAMTRDPEPSGPMFDF